MSSKIVLLEAARTKNLAAWLSRVFDDSSDAASIVVLKVVERQVDGNTKSTCHISYFNMDEIVYTWAAAMMADSASLLRGNLVEDESA